MAYEDFKDLTRRTASDKILHYKAFSIDKTPNMMDINVDLLQWSINVLIKKLLVVVLKMRNKELAEELYKSIIKKFKKRKVHSPFIDNNWGADLADMQLISKS